MRAISACVGAVLCALLSGCHNWIEVRTKKTTPPQFVVNAFLDVVTEHYRDRTDGTLAAPTNLSLDGASVRFTYLRIDAKGHASELVELSRATGPSRQEVMVSASYPRSGVDDPAPEVAKQIAVALQARLPPN
jgi:hypothetical protein